jgi:hypothetical protein
VHCAWLVHEMTQVWLVVSQTRPASPQSLSAAHCTQVFVSVSQTRSAPPPAPAPVQLVLLVHCTQRIVVVLHAVLPAVRQSLAIVHEVTQVLLVVSHTRPPSPQSLSLPHATQAPAAEQTWRPGAVHVAEVRHETHTPAVPQ